MIIPTAFNQPNLLWAGAQAPFDALMLKIYSEASPELQQKASDWEDDEDEAYHFLLEMHGALGVITIDGAMVQGEAGFWGWYFGYVGYDDIRNAVVTAVNGGAKQIMVHITSPGGMVLGIGALTDFLAEVDTTVPITFFADAYAASGGVWLATSTGKFYVSRHAEVGSVGVIAVTTEYTEYYKSLGISVEVHKSTPLKASGNHNEKLDEANRKEIQRGIQESHTRFIDSIAQGMGLTSDYVSKEIATGQVWYAQDALQKNLVSGITTYDQLIIDWQGEINQNNSDASRLGGQKPTYSVDSGDDMRRKKIVKADGVELSEEEVLALAASGVLANGDEPNEDDEEKDPIPPENENDPNEEEDPEQSSDEGNESASAGLINQLVEAKVSLKQTQAEVATLQAALATLQAEHDSLKATEVLLKTAVAEKIQRQSVAAGGPAPDKAALLAMSSSDLLGQDKSSYESMLKRFGGGGRVSVQDDPEPTDEEKKAEALAQFSNEVFGNLAKLR